MLPSSEMLVRDGHAAHGGSDGRQDLRLDVAQPQAPDRGRAVETEARSELPEGYLDIYRLAVEMTDRVSARRAVASSFFLTAQSALVALMAATSTEDWAFALPGLVLAITWWLVLRSYRRLSGAKFKVIHEMEKRLPAAPFKDEWDELKPDGGRPWRARYFELGLLERLVPAVFGAIFLIVLLADVL